MIYSILIIVFVLGYIIIALENPLRINKTAIAILLGVISWTVLIFIQGGNTSGVTPRLSVHLSAIAEIVFFLMGAMTIVELIDAHRGFSVVSNLLKTTNKVSLLWMIAFLTFFLSAILDNLTTAIVMISVLRKMMDEKEDRLIFASIIIIAANAGGAFSPIGDVTTTMLWIGGQVSAANIIVTLFIPSVVSLAIPLFYFSWKFRGQQLPQRKISEEESEPYAGFIFILGVLCFISVMSHMIPRPNNMPM